jgi:hypothetical protein
MSIQRKEDEANEARERAVAAKRKAEEEQRAAEARKLLAAGGVPPPPPPPPPDLTTGGVSPAGSASRAIVSGANACPIESLHTAVLYSAVW